MKSGKNTFFIFFLVFTVSDALETCLSLSPGRRPFFNHESRRRSVRSLPPTFQRRSTALSDASSWEEDDQYPLATQATRMRRSLAGPYWIQSSVPLRNENVGDSSSDASFTLQWSLTRLEKDNDAAIQSGRSRNFNTAACAAQVAATSEETEYTHHIPSIRLTAVYAPSEGALQVFYDDEEASLGEGGDMEFMAVLSRVLVQDCLWSWFRQSSNPPPCVDIQIRLPNEAPRTLSLSFLLASCLTSKSSLVDSEEYTSFVRMLFQQMSVDTSELVEMVHLYDDDASCRSTELWLGVVPRPWVHQYNLLHRGIGVLVTKDAALASSMERPPDLYCHQRTGTKRIFPLLYDMFVGGVSLVGEASRDTATREIAEELGLSAAFDEDAGGQRLSDRLFRCVVCTDYNRCIVDVFNYAVDTSTETIAWQKEEVAWGAFVPYDIVAVAAEQSIHRLIKANEWPGGPWQRSKNDERQDINEGLNEAVDGSWKQWDFVPDGLLVWEAWLNLQQEIDPFLLSVKSV